MAIRIVLTVNRELLHFIVDGKRILYTDRKWQKWIQCLPRDTNFLAKIKGSRNVFPAVLTQLFEFSKEELAEYDNAKDENELANIIVRDSGLKGCKLFSKQEVTLDGGE